MTRRLIALFLPFLVLALVAGCTRESPATGCRSDGQCPQGARCAAGVCQADTRPTASIVPVDGAEEFALVQLDGSTSADPDGRIVEHRWTVRAVDAPCAAPEVAGVEPVARVRFGCTGTYEVTLTVRDDLGGESDPARAAVTVSPSRGAPVVSTGPDLGADHACRGTPLQCAPTSAIRLAAAATDGVALRWTVQPPAERPLDATRRVRFIPNERAPDPVVEIVTDGTAVSGDWVFRAEAFDAYGVVGAAHTRVSIRNRPPVVTAAPAGPFDHVFDPGRAAFTAQGAVGWMVSDPDGDPVEQITGTWRHVGDGDSSTFDGDFAGSTVWFEVVVPYASPADALRLRGGAGLVRQIEISALDVNRTIGVGTIPIEIGNRPPAPAGGTFDASVPHRFDPVRKAYVATVSAGTFVDPDGDPIVDSTGPGLCDTIRARGNDVSVECSAPFQGVPSADQLVGVRTIVVRARDPWDATTQVPVRTVEIRNSPPVLAAGTPVPATVTATLYPKLGNCFSDFVVDTTEFDVNVGVSDPDGDPVLVTATTSAGGRISVQPTVIQDPLTLPFHIYQPAFMWHCAKSFPTPPISVVTGNDGAAAVPVGVSPEPVTR